MAAVTIHSNFGTPNLSLFPLFPHLFAIMGLDPMIIVFWMMSFKPAFHSPFSLSSRDSLVPLCFLPLEWYHLHIWGSDIICEISRSNINFMAVLKIGSVDFSKGKIVIMFYFNNGLSVKIISKSFSSPSWILTSATWYIAMSIRSCEFYLGTLSQESFFDLLPLSLPYSGIRIFFWTLLLFELFIC